MKIKHTLFIIAFILMTGTLVIAQQIPSSLANKYVFKGEYPITANFRGNQQVATTYNEFVQNMTKAETHIPDLIDLNFFFDTTNVAFANEMAGKYPNNLFLKVMQGNSGIYRDATPWPTTVDRISALHISFPGHWLTKPATTVTENISATSTTIQVSSATGFSIGNYMPNFPDGCPALLVETDAAGNKNWAHYEFVYITSISNTTFTVSRAYSYSPAASAFVGGKAVLAPLIVTTWNEPPVWYINMSTNCPLDANGKKAADVLLDDIKTRFNSTSALSNFSGIDFASGPFTDPPADVDYNFDGVIDSPTEYYNGVNAFLSSVRAHYNNNFIILAGNTNINYIENFNGLNNEGLVEPDDPWRGISNTMNENNFWLHNSATPQLSMNIIRIQDNTTAGINNKSKWVQLTRMGNGYSTCLGFAVDIKEKIFDNATNVPSVVALTWVELFKGTENQEHWLGKPTSPVIQVLSKTPSILGDSSTNWAKILPKLSFSNGTMSIVNNELILTPNSNVNHILTIDLDLSQTDNLTILFDVKAEGTQEVRSVVKPQLSVTSLTNARSTANYTNSEYMPLEFYWRHLNSTATSSCKATFNFTGTEPIRIRSMSAHEAPNCIARSFENGVVLVNPGLEDYTFDLSSLFGTDKSYTRLQAPTLNVPAEWEEQYQQTMEMNSGKKISNPANVVVPALNALFLKSESIITSINEQHDEKFLIIYPNPAKQNTTISFSEINTIKSIVIINIVGQIVFEILVNTKINKAQIDLSNLQQGSYFIKLQTDNGIIVKKLIKE